MPTHMMNKYAKFHWNPSTKYRDIASRKVTVNGQPMDDLKQIASAADSLMA